MAPIWHQHYFEWRMGQHNTGKATNTCRVCQKTSPRKLFSLLRIFCLKMLWKLEIVDLQLCTRISTPSWISSWLVSPSVVSLDMGCKSRNICSKSTRNTNLWRRSWHEGWEWSCLDWVVARQQPAPGQFSGSNKNSPSWSTSTYLDGSIL